MSEWIGKIVACDRCGKEYRCKLAGVKELDGGFSRALNFDPMGDGWSFRYEIGWLCPECNSKYESLVKDFKERND